MKGPYSYWSGRKWFDGLTEEQVLALNPDIFSKCVKSFSRLLERKIKIAVETRAKPFIKMSHLAFRFYREVDEEFA